MIDDHVVYDSLGPAPADLSGRLKGATIEPQEFTSVCTEQAKQGARQLIEKATGVRCVGDMGKTPERMARALAEMTQGYQIEPAAVLGTTFDVRFDEVVVLKGIRFTSLCEHHVLPFTGVAHVAYLPADRVVGLSKLARLVDAYARRLQVQERLTQQITNALMDVLKPRGAAAVIRGHHSCMGCRGVKQPDAEMVTSSMLGFFRTDKAARDELLRLIGDV